MKQKQKEAVIKAAKIAAENALLAYDETIESSGLSIGWGKKAKETEE